MDGDAKVDAGGGRVVVIAGPTASGKTGLAAKLAARLGGFVVNADSRQVYAELDVGVAKPTAAELALAPHALVGYRTLDDVCSAGAWARDAREAIEAGFAARRPQRPPNPTAVVAGGTGLYVDALVRGMPDMPAVDPGVVRELQGRLDAGELPALLAELERLDPAYHAAVDRANGARVVRALAVMRAGGGTTFTALRARPRATLPYPVRYVVLDPDRERLYARIEARVDAMVADGLEAEARSLYPRRHLRPVQTIGYREWWPYVAGEATREEAIAEVKRATRHYARRQLTWNRKLPGLRLPHPDVEAVLTYLAAAPPASPPA